MAYVELYTDKVFELINLGKTIRQFNESNGDYLMVQIFKENSVNPINELYSNKLLFRTSDDKSYYFGDYHYHNSGYMVGKKHTTQPHEGLIIEKQNQFMTSHTQSTEWNGWISSANQIGLMSMNLIR